LNILTFNLIGSGAKVILIVLVILEFRICTKAVPAHRPKGLDLVSEGENEGDLHNLDRNVASLSCFEEEITMEESNADKIVGLLDDVEMDSVDLQHAALHHWAKKSASD